MSSSSSVSSGDRPKSAAATHATSCMSIKEKRTDAFVRAHARPFRAWICVACRAIQTSQQPVPLFRLLFRLKTNRSGTGTAARAHQRQSASACALTVPRSAT